MTIPLFAKLDVVALNCHILFHQDLKAFANPAAYGDLLAAVLALVAIFALRTSWKSAIFWVWIFNIEGTIDLLNAVGRGIMFNTDGHMGATFFIPIVIVPLLLVSHGIIFQLLIKKNKPNG